jgi:hypothetical protein
MVAGVDATALLDRDAATTDLGHRAREDDLAQDGIEYVHVNAANVILRPEVKGAAKELAPIVRINRPIRYD